MAPGELCRSRGCPNYVCASSTFCNIHTCSYPPTCNNPTTGIQPFCLTHTCTLQSGNRQCRSYIWAPGMPSCIQHKCTATFTTGATCSNMIFGLDHIYCLDHVCLVSLCKNMNMRAKGSSYCVGHKCASEGCPEQKLIEEDKCKKHHSESCCVVM